MPPVTRIGDICTGHGPCPPRPNDEASPDVFTNNLNTHRQGDHWITHCVHDSVLAAGSATVFVNFKQIARIGDPIECGSAIAEGSSNVFAGP